MKSEFTIFPIKEGIFPSPRIQVALKLALANVTIANRKLESLNIVCALGLLSGCLWNSDAMWTSLLKPAGEEHMRESSSTPAFPEMAL